MQGSKPQAQHAEYYHVRYKGKCLEHNTTYDVTRFTTVLPGAYWTPSLSVTYSLYRNFVRFTPVCVLKVITLLLAHLRVLPTLVLISVRGLVIYVGVLYLQVLLQI